MLRLLLVQDFFGNVGLIVALGAEFVEGGVRRCQGVDFLSLFCGGLGDRLKLRCGVVALFFCARKVFFRGDDLLRYGRGLGLGGKDTPGEGGDLLLIVVELDLLEKAWRATPASGVLLR